MQVRPSSSPQATATVVTVIALDAGPEAQRPDVNGRQRTSTDVAVVRSSWQRADRLGRRLMISDSISHTHTPTRPHTHTRTVVYKWVLCIAGWRLALDLGLGLDRTGLEETLKSVRTGRICW